MRHFWVNIKTLRSISSSCVEAAYLILFVVTYVVIFKCFKNTRIRPSVSSRKDSVSSWRIFWKSRFYIAIMLILTFGLMVIIPDLLSDRIASKDVDCFEFVKCDVGTLLDLWHRDLCEDGPTVQKDVREKVELHLLLFCVTQINFVQKEVWVKRQSIRYLHGLPKSLFHLGKQNNVKVLIWYDQAL